MVTKMRKKINSLLGTKNSLQGLWSGGETRTLGAKNGIKSLKKKKRNFMILSAKKKSLQGALGWWIGANLVKEKRKPENFPILHIYCFYLIALFRGSLCIYTKRYMKSKIYKHKLYELKQLPKRSVCRTSLSVCCYTALYTFRI